MRGSRLRARFALLLALVGRAAWAQVPVERPVELDRGAPPDDVARTKFAAALKLYGAGQHEQALVLFRELVDATGSPNARLYVGLCLEQLGRIVDAYQELARTAKEASLRTDTKYDRTRDAAVAEMAALDARVGKLVITLIELPAGLVVTVDGRKLDEREIGAQLVLEPGTHRIEASAPGRTTAMREARLDGGDTRTVTLALADSEVTRAAADHGAHPPMLQIAGYATAGIAAAGLSMFVVGGLLARGRYEKLQDACGDGPCSDPKYQADIEAGKTLQTVANVGLAMGVAGAALSATFLLVASKKENARLAAEPRRGGGYVRYELDF